MTMDSSSLLAPMCLISGAGGLDNANPGIDLTLAWDLCDFIGTQSSTASAIEATLDVSPLAIALGEDEDKQLLGDEAEKGLDDLLDFELSSDVLDFINTIDIFSAVSDETETPAAAQPTLDIDLSTAMTSPASTFMADSTSPSSNSSSGGDEDDSLLDSPAPSGGRDGLKRTRSRAIDKRQSNKAAAIKYRTKKLQEKELLFAECAEYERKNGQLKRLIDDVQTEISFIKSLLVEALIAKNVAKTPSS